MAYTDRYVTHDAASGGDGTLASPWTLSAAINNARNGDRINVKAGPSPYKILNIVSNINACRMANAQALGTHQYPVLWRGYTTTPGDGGMVKIMPYNSAWSIFISGEEAEFPDYPYSLTYQNFEFESGIASEYGTVYSRDTIFKNCIFRNTAQLGVARSVNSRNSHFYGCTLESQHKGDTGYAEAVAGAVSMKHCRINFADCGFRSEPEMATEWTGYAHSHFEYCVFHGAEGSRAGVRATRGNFTNCSFYRSQTGVESVYDGSSVDGRRLYVLNNVFVGHTTALSIASGSYHGIIVLNNKAFGCTANLGGAHGAYWTGGIDALSVNPYNDAANGDYSVPLAAAPGLYKKGVGGLNVGASPINEDVPHPVHVRLSHPYDRHTGKTKVGELELPAVAHVRAGFPYDDIFNSFGFLKTGNMRIPAATDVRAGVEYDAPSSPKTGSLELPAATDVRAGVDVGGDTGLLDIPAEGSVTKGTVYDNQTKTGSFECPPLPDAADVRDGVLVGIEQGRLKVPEPEDVRIDVPVDDTTGLLDLPQEKHVLSGVEYDNRTKTGTYEPVEHVPRNLIFKDESHENTLDSER